MKKIIKWTLFILIASAAMAAGMFALAQYLDSKEPANDSDTDKGNFKAVSKSFTRHYTKLNLYKE